MRQILWILGVVLILSQGSCCRYFSRHCIQEERSDTLWRTHVDTFWRIRDTTIYVPVPIPGERIVDSVPYPVKIDPDGLINSDSLIMETDLARAIAWVEKSILKGELVQKDTVLIMEILLEDAIKERDIYRDSLAIVTNEKYVLQHEKARIKTVLWLVLAVLVAVILIKLINLVRGS